MSWQKEIIQEKIILAMGHLMVLFALLSFFFGSNLLLFMFILGSLLALANHLYLKHVGSRLFLQNQKSIVRLNINDNTEWKFTFVNKGLPILKGNIQLSFNNKLEPIEHPFTTVGSTIEVNVPFKAWHNEQIDIMIPIKAIKRGVSSVHNIEIRIPHLFGNGIVILQNKMMISQKKLIFPERKVVKTTNKEYSFLQGVQNQQSSIFFDPLQPIGTREYQNGDPFQYIHWKASARTQQLQTKVFSNIGARTWLILLNVEEDRNVHSNLENLISYCAYLIDYAVNENIPFALAINVKTLGESIYYYLNDGDGRQQRQNSFDLLTYLSITSFTIPYHLMLKNVFQKGLSYPYVVHIGDTNPTIRTSLLNFSKKGSMVFSVRPSANQGVMELWK
jgi:uncharacterized protein (DUF58 family)